MVVVVVVGVVAVGVVSVVGVAVELPVLIRSELIINLKKKTIRCNVSY